MNIKKLTKPILIIGLSIGFAIVGLGVYLTRGKSKFWISKKMLLGSLLISLTSVINQSCEERVIAECYDPVPPNEIKLDNYDYFGKVDINIALENKITGILYDRSGEDFSFNITDTVGTDTVQVGDITPSDGKFDESTEDIYIEIDRNIPVGEYLLNLYITKQSEQDYPVSTYRLNVRNED
jgi:hypothetical protein